MYIEKKEEFAMRGVRKVGSVSGEFEKKKLSKTTYCVPRKK
jgi:hypothetical protein